MKVIRFLKAVVILMLPLWVMGQDVVPDEVKIDYTASKKNLHSILVELSEISDVNITFNPSSLQPNKTLSLTAKNRSLRVILNAVLNGTEHKYKIVGDQLVIVEDEFISSEEIITISGYLTDSLSGEPLIYANIFNQLKEEGTNTNEYGFYSFSLNKGVQRIYYSYLGYKKEILELTLKKDTVVNIELSPDAVLNEVLILDRQVDEQEVSLYSEDIIPVNKIWSISSLGGESDIFGMAQMMSGVTSGADGLGGLNVRGGSFDQNLVLFDGVPVYNTTHAIGIFSIFNPNTIKSSKLIKGSFPARYGGRLSSVFDIRTKDGSTKKLKGDVSLGSVAFRGTLEGPLGKNGSSFLVSVRRTHLDLWLLDIMTNIINSENSTQREPDYSFLDFNAKINLQLGKKNKLSLSFYNGNDKLFNQLTRTLSTSSTSPIETNVLDTDWGNQILSLRLNSELGQKLYHNLTLYSSGFVRDNFSLQQFTSGAGGPQTRTYNTSLFQSGVQDLGLKSDFDYVPNTSHYLKFGLGVVRHKFNPGLINLDQRSMNISGEIDKDTLSDLLVAPDIIGSEIYTYIEDEIKIGKNVKANLGLRYNLVKTETTFDHSIEPRLGLLVEKNRTFFKLGVSRMSQYLHLLSNGGFGLPSEVWIPSTDRIRPEKSWVYNAGLGFNLSESLEVQIEGYYKSFNQIIALSEGVNTPIDETSDWEETLPIGEGTAYGLEFNINKRYGISNIWANYTWSKSLRNFEGVNNNNDYAFRFDRTHQFKFLYIQKINKNAEFSANWQIATGTPVSVPYEVITLYDNEGNPFPSPQYEGINLENFPLYHRLDLGFNFYNKYDWANQKFSVGVYNAYSRKNPYYLDLGFSETIPQNFQTYQYTILPFALPYISYSISF